MNTTAVFNIYIKFEIFSRISHICLLHYVFFTCYISYIVNNLQINNIQDISNNMDIFPALTFTVLVLEIY